MCLKAVAYDVCSIVKHSVLSVVNQCYLLPMDSNLSNAYKVHWPHTLLAGLGQVYSTTVLKGSPEEELDICSSLCNTITEGVSAAGLLPERAGL